MTKKGAVQRKGCRKNLSLWGGELRTDAELTTARRGRHDGILTKIRKGKKGNAKDIERIEQLDKKKAGNPKRRRT